MISSPIWWGAGLACALGGAIAGSAVGSTPMLDRSTIADMLSSDSASGVAPSAAMPPLPDHYPLITREGAVPVAALSTRGLYSQKRYRFAMQFDDDRPLAMPDDDFGSGADQPFPQEAADLPAGGRSGELISLADAAMAHASELSIGSDDSPGSGHAKRIDVAASLALN